MGKIRVHELAKELGLDNREALLRLQAAGIAVKTHSSSVYEEEARAALGQAKAPEALAPSRRPGMVIVKKAKTQTAEPVAEPAVTGPAQSEPAQMAEAEQVEAPTHEPVMAAEGPLTIHPPEIPEPAPSDEPAVPGEGVAAEAAPVPVEPVAEPVAPVAETPALAEVAPTAPTAAPPPHTPVRPAAVGQPGAARVVRMIDRDKLMERVPSRRFGGAVQKGPVEAPKFGEVTELRVVQDPYGRGREMVDVGHDKKGAKGQKVVKKERLPSKRDMIDMRERSMHPTRLKKKKTVSRNAKKTELTQPKASKRVIRMRDTIALIDLAHQMGAKATEVIGKLVGLGKMVTINDAVDLETAQLVAAELEYTVESTAFAEDQALESAQTEERAEDMRPRPPVVTVMGHVDHGKTSLLDAIRKTHVAAGEAGGITQHIGAYQVHIKGKGAVTFLDTPGHAAFTSMRARGAKVTDLVVLVVAADDGVMPQTEEAIQHAQAAGVPIIVAVNKSDKAEANLDRIMQQLTKYNLVTEAWGGDTLAVPTSATKGTGIQELLDAILLQSEMLELNANPTQPATAVVIEAELDKGKGPVATVLVQEGTLHRGDSVVVGEWSGKIRAMVDDQGRAVKEAGPSMPVEILGLDGVPDAGDLLNAVENAEVAREIAAHRTDQKRAQGMTSRAKVSLEDLMSRIGEGETLTLRLVLKADVQGSVEAIRDAVVKLATDEVKIAILGSGVGAINETDIMLAAASKGIVVGFGVRPDTNARTIAEHEGVEIRIYTIIYELLDDVKKAMEGLLAPESREKFVGRAEVREVYHMAKVGTVAGCRVTEGKAMRSARVRVLRDSVQVFDGKLASLKHFKNDAREVESGLECGLGIDNWGDEKVGDVIEFYTIEEIARTLGAAPAKKREHGGSEARP